MTNTALLVRGFSPKWEFPRHVKVPNGLFFNCLASSLVENLLPNTVYVGSLGSLPAGPTCFWPEGVPPRGWIELWWSILKVPIHYSESVMKRGTADLRLAGCLYRLRKTSLLPAETHFPPLVLLDSVVDTELFRFGWSGSEKTILNPKIQNTVTGTENCSGCGSRSESTFIWLPWIWIIFFM